MTEEEIQAMVARFEALLRSKRRVEVEYTIGVNHYSADGMWESAEPNGSATWTIRVDGGALDTREATPRNVQRAMAEGRERQLQEES